MLKMHKQLFNTKNKKGKVGSFGSAKLAKKNMLKIRSKKVKQQTNIKRGSMVTGC